MQLKSHEIGTDIKHTRRCSKVHIKTIGTDPLSKNSQLDWITETCAIIIKTVKQSFTGILRMATSLFHYYPRNLLLLGFNFDFSMFILATTLQLSKHWPNVVLQRLTKS